MAAESSIREPAVAGMFYPADRQLLVQEIDSFLKNVERKKVSGDLLGLISPHAGYMYSGYTAASGYALLEGKTFETVVIVAPSHREYFDGISVFPGQAYRTPLGVLSVDDGLRSELLRDGDVIISSNHGHGAEHAIEVQLPFLQRLLGEFKILPIVMGDQRGEYCALLGEKLANVLKKKNVLLVGSSDLSHYYPYEVARRMDQVIVEDVRDFNETQLLADLETRQGEACGGGPIVAVLTAAKKLGADSVEIMHYCNSGDVTGDRSGVVGYLSAAVLKTHP
jgi:AmmeMemoRadiSam system protein B